MSEIEFGPGPSVPLPQQTSNNGIQTQSAVDFAAVREDDAEPLLGDEATNILPAGGNMVIWGSEGASKTSVALDLAFHFATGTDWLGISVPKGVTVLFVENEGPRGPLRRKVDAKLQAWTGPPPDGLSFLVEPWARFSFRDDLARAELAAKILMEGIQVLIVGPVSTLGMLGAGTPADVREFMVIVDELRAEVSRLTKEHLGIERYPLAIIFVHHDNKAGDISGAWGPAPDTLVHVTLQGHGHTRLFWQKCRWASKLHGTSFQLAWADGGGFDLEEREEITEDTIGERLLAAVVEQPGGSWSKIRPNLPGRDADKAKVRDRLIAAGEIVNTAARDGYFNLWLADDPAATRAGLGTGWARLTEAPLDGQPSSTRAAVPDVVRHGNGHGTAPPGKGTTDHADSAPDNAWWTARLADEPEPLEEPA